MVHIWTGVTRLLIAKFSDCDATPLPDGEGVRLRVGGESHRLSEGTARALRAALGEALARRQEFTHTAGERRPDGSYVVTRRRAESAGHRKVFDSWRALRALYEDLPQEFTAEDVEGSGLSGGRRHIVVRHLAEHPGFDCTLVARQPLTAYKG